MADPILNNETQKEIADAARKYGKLASDLSFLAVTQLPAVLSAITAAARAIQIAADTKRKSD